MRFSTSSFQFGTIPFGATLDMGLKHEFEWGLDDALIESGRLPSLNSAPLSSWLIARLRWLDNSLPAEVEEQNDGGGYCFEMAVATGASVVAGFQLQGDMGGVAVLGRAKDAETVDRVLKELVLLLAESPTEVAECCYTVFDPEWQSDPDSFAPAPNEESRNEYGWRDGTYLGEHNIREK